MEYLAQELTDGIIDCVPLECMRSCSLVARNWRRRSQQRNFEIIWFKNEDLAGRWYTRISQDPEGIPSYVRLAQFGGLSYCREPGMLDRILRCFVNLRSLRLIQVELSLLSEQRNPIRFDNFGRGVTELLINNPVCTYSTFISLILSLPCLDNLVLLNPEPKGTPPPTSLSTPKRVLKELSLSRGRPEVAITLSQCPLSFRTIVIYRPPCMEGSSAGLRALIAASSRTVRNITIGDLAYTSDEEDRTSHPCAELPSLTALRELRVHLSGLRVPPRWSANFLAAITSAPELSSIYFGSSLLPFMSPEGIEGCASDDRWILIDRWLGRLAEGRGRYPVLKVVLSIPIGRKPRKLGSFLSGCRGVGVEVVMKPE